MSLNSDAALEATIARVWSSELGVAPAYRHVAKHVVTGDEVALPAALLKWYELHPQTQPVPEDVRHLARAALETGALSVNGLGFVVLHRCDHDFYFLIVVTWRQENEMWQTVWYKNGAAMADFEFFSRPSLHIPTFCVWELVPVWHEQAAWVRFLISARDEGAVREWLLDVYTGTA